MSLSFRVKNRLKFDKRFKWKVRFDFFYNIVKRVIIFFNLLKNWIKCYMIQGNYINFWIDKKFISLIAQFLKFSLLLKCNQLLDMFIIDKLMYLNETGLRFECVYVFISLTYNIRFFIRFFVTAFDQILTLTKIFPSSDWFEREAFDMFGLFFKGHYNLRRILTDYGFVGHPFRKDFPLTGYSEVRYDDIRKTVVSEPLELTQEYRYFRLENPWRKLA